MIRARVILIIVNLVTILLLTIFAAVVFDRILIDRFTPPSYSIWARPGETWHRAEFVISPSYGFDMAIDGRSIFNYSNENSSDARRPRLVASYLPQ
jgi:hypothetical protein